MTLVLDPTTEYLRINTTLLAAVAFISGCKVEVWQKPQWCKCVPVIGLIFL